MMWENFDLFEELIRLFVLVVVKQSYKTPFIFVNLALILIIFY